MSDQTVWVACGSGTTNPDTYHTDSGCQQLQIATDTRPVELGGLGGQYAECKVCSGEYDHYTGQNSKYYEQALATDPDRLDG